MHEKNLIPVENITTKIFLIRSQKVMLDRDLAELYGVETRTLTQAVRRNIKRFPQDFMFILKEREYNNLRSQFVISSWGGRRYKPMAFTEQGIAMLSSVLRSDRAIEVNIAIMRAFVKMREMLASSREFAEKLETLERRIDGHDEQIKIVFDAIRQLIVEEEKPKPKIGF